jgi:hypothetical protein
MTFGFKQIRGRRINSLPDFAIGCPRVFLLRGAAMPLRRQKLHNPVVCRQLFSAQQGSVEFELALITVPQYCPAFPRNIDGSGV